MLFPRLNPRLGQELGAWASFLFLHELSTLQWVGPMALGEGTFGEQAAFSLKQPGLQGHSASSFHALGGWRSLDPEL